MHRRRFVLIVSALALLVVSTAAASYSSGEEALAKAAPADSTTSNQKPRMSLASGTYAADLTGPAADSGASATVALTVEYDAETGTLSYRLDIAEIVNPSVAAICQGSPGTKGTTVVTLFPGPTLTGPFSGVLAKGTLTGEDLVGPLRNGTVEDLVSLLDAGGAYVTVGTSDFPIDAVRGQIGRIPPPTPDEPDGETSL